MWPIIYMALIFWIGIGGSLLSHLNRGDLEEPREGQDKDEDLLWDLLKNEGPGPFFLIIALTLFVWPIMLAIIAHGKDR